MKRFREVVSVFLIVMLGKIVTGLSSTEADMTFRALGCRCCSSRRRGGSRSASRRKDTSGRNSRRRGRRRTGMKCLRVVVAMLLVLVLGKIISRCNCAESHVMSGSCSRRSADIDTHRRNLHMRRTTECSISRSSCGGILCRRRHAGYGRVHALRGRLRHRRSRRDPSAVASTVVTGWMRWWHPGSGRGRRRYSRSGRWRHRWLIRRTSCGSIVLWRGRSRGIIWLRCRGSSCRHGCGRRDPPPVTSIGTIVASRRLWWHRRLIRRTSGNSISLALALVLTLTLPLSLIVPLILTLSLAALVLPLSLACTIVVVGVVIPVGRTSTSDASSFGELVSIPEDDDSADLASKGMRR